MGRPTFVIEVNQHGYSRIVAPDQTKGNFVRYEGIASVVYNGSTYYAASDYWEGVLPTGIVFVTENQTTDIIDVEITEEGEWTDDRR